MTRSELYKEIETPSFTVTLVPAERQYAAIKTRVYAPNAWMGDTATPESTLKGEKPEIDKQWRAYNRLELERERTYIAELVAELRELLAKDVTQSMKNYDDVRNLAYLLEGKLTFSRKAGCGCGCSPGFISSFKLQYVPDGRTYGVYAQQVSIGRKLVTVARPTQEEKDAERTFTFADFLNV